MSYKRITLIVEDKVWEKHKASKMLFNAILRRMNESEYLWDAIRDIQMEDAEIIKKE